MNVPPSPWSGTSGVASLAGSAGAVTLVEGSTFCLSGRTGDISSEFPHGLFVLDTRVLSCWQLRLNGHRLEPLAVSTPEPFSAVFVGRGHPEANQADADLVCFRHRDIGRGMRERLVVANHGLRGCSVEIEITCDVDFADVFEVKESRVRPRGRHTYETEDDVLRFGFAGDGPPRSVDIQVPGASSVEVGTVRWRARLDPKATFELCLEVQVGIDGTMLRPRFVCDGGEVTDETTPHQRMATWRARLPEVSTDNGRLAEAVTRSAEDLGALRIFDPDHPEVPILAAGAPWFMTVFGRDSLLTAWMTLIADPRLAQGVLETLARFQGADVVDETEEEPGKILHEMRFGGAASLALGGSDIYYGTVDATPLFVMLLAELHRWGADDEFVRRMLPHADRAMAWLDTHGDRDGDGYVEYRCRSSAGLANQGWKDSWDAIRFAGGELAEPPIALCEVQGYVYAAQRGRADLARAFGDDALARRWDEAADDLRRRFNEDFWLDERGWFALALDAEKRPVDALASNMGHCLWTGIVDPEKATDVADALLSPELFSGWGVRTLATSMRAFNPVSYHNGSVWPHDNALCAAGLARYGFVDRAHRIIEGQLAVAGQHRGQLPELFAGFDRAELAMPAAYPTSCSPQAWASASPLLWLRSLLRLDPDAGAGRIRVDPAVPEWIGRLRLAGIRIAGRRVTVEVDGDSSTVTGADGLEVVGAPPEPNPPVEGSTSSRRSRRTS